MNETLKGVVFISVIFLFVAGLAVLAYWYGDKTSTDVPVPEEYPLTNMAEVVSKAEMVLPPCDGVDWYIQDATSDLPVDGFGYYGYRATTIIDGESRIVGYVAFAECIIVLERNPDGTEKSGTFAWRYQIDPNNGYVVMDTCNYDLLPDECPKNPDGSYVWVWNDFSDNPDYETYMGLEVK